MATHPKVLGLTLDPTFTYSTHINNISVQAHNPLQMIKALTSTGWGKQKETVMATYKAVTNIQHMHDETLILPIHEHLQLHASQYKHKTQHPSHPLHKHTT